MVSIAENWTSISGEIRSVDVLVSPAGFLEITLLVANQKKHKSFPDLVRVPASKELKIKLSAELAADLHLETGTRIAALVRSAGPNGYYVKPDSVKVL